MKTTKILLIFAMALGSVGCSLDASLEQISKDVVEPLLQKAQLTGFISGSSQGKVTSGGYRVESSTGNYTNKLQATTSGGYKVFVSVQGNIVSE
jgi:hypothetical protein